MTNTDLNTTAIDTETETEPKTFWTELAAALGNLSLIALVIEMMS